MKLSFSSLAAPQWSWLKTIEQALVYGFDGVEWRLIDGETVGSDFPRKECLKIRKAVRQAGLKSCALDTGLSLTHPPGAGRNTVIEEALQLFEIAHDLEAGLLRLFPGQYPERVTDHQAIDWLTETLSALLPAAESSGIKLALETHDSFEWSRKHKRGSTTSMIIKQVFHRLESTQAGILWDLGNPYLEGETIHETWQNVKDHLLYVHSKDLIRTDDNDWIDVPPGEGIIPLDQVVTYLKSIGFDGWISFEWEKKWHPELAEPEIVLPAYIKYMKSIM